MPNVSGRVRRALDWDWAFGLSRNLLADLGPTFVRRVTALLGRETLMPPCSPSKGGNMKTMCITRSIRRSGVLAIVAGLSLSSGPGLFAEPDPSFTPFKY